MHKLNSNKDHSILYHLEPIGLDTENVESLTSYLSRLSEAHCLPVKYLIDSIILPESNLTKSENLNNLVFYKESSKTINGVGIYAEEFITPLKKLTLRNELNYLTMLPLKNIIDNRGKGLLKNKKEWCPYCYSEQINDFGIMYDLLQWSINLVNRCHKHKIKLQNQCL